MSVQVYFFGGPYHANKMVIPTDPDEEHLLGAPPKMELVRNDQFPEYRDGDLVIEAFGSYIRTDDLEEGALVYRWEGPEWDMMMEGAMRDMGED